MMIETATIRAAAIQAWLALLVARENETMLLLAKMVLLFLVLHAGICIIDKLVHRESLDPWNTAIFSLIVTWLAVLSGCLGDWSN